MRSLVRGFAGIPPAPRSAMRRKFLPLLLLLMTACASAPTTDFDVRVAQNDAVPYDGGRADIPGIHSVGLDITVENRTAAAWKVEGVAVQTVGSQPLLIPKRAERWDQTLGPGEAKTFQQRWPAAASVGFGTREIPLRVELYLVSPDGTRRTESFVR